MKRGGVIFLAISVGFNIGLLVIQLSEGRGPGRPHEQSFPHPQRADPQGRLHEFGQPPSQDVNEIIGRHLKGTTEHLQLNDNQKAAIEDGLRDILPLILSKQQQAHEARRALAEHYSSPDISPGQFRALIANINHAQAQIDSLAGEAILAESQVLTPEQRQRYFPVMPWRRPGPPPR